MKRILLFLCIIIVIPIIVLSIFVREEKFEFKFYSNMFIRVKRTSGVIEYIPLEEYIVGVVAGEMPITFHKEALKAQAVAARSYAMKKMAYNYKNEYDVVDTIANQVYLDNEYLKKAWGVDYEKNVTILRTVVFETGGEYLEYDGDVIEAFYFSTSTGITENSEDVFGSSLPYLRSVESTWDKISPVYNETKTFPVGSFCKSLGISSCNELNINITEKTTTGRIKKISINGNSFTGDEMRSKLGLKSNCFSITKSNNNVIIATKGYGHGVGMSQYGAYGMALEGYKYEEILKYYYKGVNIQKL